MTMWNISPIMLADQAIYDDLVESFDDPAHEYKDELILESLESRRQFDKNRDKKMATFIESVTNFRSINYLGCDMYKPLKLESTTNKNEAKFDEMAKLIANLPNLQEKGIISIIIEYTREPLLELFLFSGGILIPFKTVYKFPFTDFPATPFICFYKLEMGIVAKWLVEKEDIIFHSRIGQSDQRLYSGYYGMKQYKMYDWNWKYERKRLGEPIVPFKRIGLVTKEQENKNTPELWQRWKEYRKCELKKFPGNIAED